MFYNKFNVPPELLDASRKIMEELLASDPDNKRTKKQEESDEKEPVKIVFDPVIPNIPSGNQIGQEMN